MSESSNDLVHIQGFFFSFCYFTNQIRIGQIFFTRFQSLPSHKPNKSRLLTSHSLGRHVWSKNKKKESKANESEFLEILFKCVWFSGIQSVSHWFYKFLAKGTTAQADVGRWSEDERCGVKMSPEAVSSQVSQAISALDEVPLTFC